MSDTAMNTEDIPTTNHSRNTLADRATNNRGKAIFKAAILVVFVVAAIIFCAIYTDKRLLERRRTWTVFGHCRDMGTDCVYGDLCRWRLSIFTGHLAYRSGCGNFRGLLGICLCMVWCDGRSEYCFLDRSDFR